MCSVPQGSKELGFSSNDKNLILVILATFVHYSQVAVQLKLERLFF